MVETVTSSMTDADHDGLHSFVVFQLGGEGYALGVMRVQEVLDLQAMTEIPGSPRSLLGMINLRGRVVPIYDLRIPFGLAAAAGRTSRALSVIIVETEPGNDAQIAGLVVDRVSDVREFGPEDVQSPPQLGLGTITPFVRGLIRHQNGFLLVLDLDRVFSALAKLNGEGT